MNAYTIQGMKGGEVKSFRIDANSMIEAQIQVNSARLLTQITSVERVPTRVWASENCFEVIATNSRGKVLKRYVVAPGEKEVEEYCEVFDLTLQSCKLLGSAYTGSEI